MPPPYAKTPSSEYPLSTKLLAWAGLVSVQLFASIVLKLASHDRVYPFSPQSSLVLSEAIKAILSFFYLIHTNSGTNSAHAAFRIESSVPLVFHMTCLASIYCLNNALMFWLFARADPGSISLIKSGATIVSAALMFFVRGFRLGSVRWGVLIVQMFGLVVAQFDSCRGRAYLPGAVYTMLFISLLNSSVANVWNEWVVKRFEGASLATKNIWLYLFGAILNLGLFVVYGGAGKRFWEGYTGIGAVVVVSNAFMGIAMNAVYKYADAVVKNIATTTTTVVLLAVSAVAFEGRKDVMVFIGGGVVFVGTFLYFGIGKMEERLAELQKKLGGISVGKAGRVRNMKGNIVGVRTCAA